MPRLFVAIEISDEARAVMRRRLGRLHSVLPAARWVDPAQAHLTLAFLGPTDEAHLEPLRRALAPVFTASPPLELVLHGVGTFPPGRPARVAWVGVKGPPELLDLRREVGEAVSAVTGQPPERRPFHPHVTLARCRSPWARKLAEGFLQEGHGPWGEPFTVEEGVLFESELGPRGARYTVRDRFPLGGAG